jgi:hypothetical protein
MKRCTHSKIESIADCGWTADSLYELNRQWNFPDPDGLDALNGWVRPAQGRFGALDASLVPLVLTPRKFAYCIEDQ